MWNTNTNNIHYSNQKRLPINIAKLNSSQSKIINKSSNNNHIRISQLLKKNQTLNQENLLNNLRNHARFYTIKQEKIQ